MRKPLRCKWRATDSPVRPMPTTTAFGAVCAACGLTQFQGRETREHQDEAMIQKRTMTFGSAQPFSSK